MGPIKKTSAAHALLVLRDAWHGLDIDDNFYLFEVEDGDKDNDDEEE